MSVASEFPAEGADRRITIEGADVLSTDAGALSAERPFPGLRPFAFADRAYFFGRERQIAALRNLLEDNSFIAVVGSSGCGKSSLVLAGLGGLLTDERADPGGRKWVWLSMRPGASPLVRLAAALARLAADDGPQEAAKRQDRIEWRLRKSSFSFGTALEEAGGLRGRSLVLMVDQFEELFRFGLAGLGLSRVGIEETRAQEEATQFVQILLDVANRRPADVRLLITMRSDFIGDCAYFYGLSDAVSAAQFLVPNLTRGEREETILKPIEKAGASIEPELVERLINDCSVELDWLPILEHCLMRLWDRAGAMSAGESLRITRESYDAIGRMTGALSRHADEVLAECAGRELAVEQAFRALSELDREGMAIRRALRFEQLAAESGVQESDLRLILDSFRRPSCSFLVPPPSLAPRIAQSDHVDIGHEALLRRWRRLSGDREEADPTTGRPLPGWLFEEEMDGQRYRTLLSLVEASAGGETVTLSNPDATKAWWERVPRTPAWAERYGGRLDAVLKLIDDGVAAKRRSKLIRRFTAVAGLLFIVGLATAVGERFIAAKTAQANLVAEATDRSAMTSAKTLLENVLHAYNDRSLDLAGAEGLATIAGEFLDGARASRKTAAADLIWAQALIANADLEATLGRNPEALVLARKAQDAALALSRSDAKAAEPLQTLYDASIRVGDYRSMLGSFGDARGEYNDAILVAERVAALSGSQVGQRDVVEAHLKLGDLDEELHQSSPALAEYQSAMAISEAALVKNPESFDLQRNQGRVYYRLAELLRKENSFDNARALYDKTSRVQEALVARNAKDAVGAPGARDPTLKSNLAATYTHWGMLESKAGEPNLALSKLQQGVALDEELIKAEPGNPQWINYAIPNYRYLTELLERMNRPEDALVYYRRLFDATRTLAFPASGPPRNQRQFAEAAKLLGDHSVGLAQIDAFREAVRIWSRLVADQKAAQSAEDQYDVLLGFADAFSAKKDWPDAQAAYLVAMKVAVMNYVKDPSATSWRDKADAAARASASSTEAANTVPPPP